MPSQQHAHPPAPQLLSPPLTSPLPASPARPCFLQIGEVLLDVAPGVPCQFRQDVAVVSARDRACVKLAPVAQRVVVTPDLDTLLRWAC